MVIHKQKEGKAILIADIILFEISRDATTQIKDNINYPQAKAPFTNCKQFKKWNLRDPLYLLIIRINLKRSDMDKNINGKTQSMEIRGIDFGRYLRKNSDIRHTSLNQKFLYQEQKPLKSCKPRNTVDLKPNWDNQNGV